MSRYIVTGDSSSCSSGVVCKDTTLSFYGTLATKLLDMAESIHTRIENLKKSWNIKPSSGVIMAEIEVAKMVIGVKAEYLEYVRRYGPPVDGIFEPAKLALIRDQLNISNTEYEL